jgi:hypothetical protein
MQHDLSNRCDLSPGDLTLCERVLERLCAERGVDSNGLAAQTLASEVLVAFQHGITDEQALFAFMTARSGPVACTSAYEAMTETRRAIRSSQQLLDRLNDRR